MVEGDGGQVEAWLDALIEAIISGHDAIISASGGLLGLHRGTLEAACARPFQTAFGEDVYADPFSKSAAIFHAIICDHAFVDGNKRTGTVAAMAMLGYFRAIDDAAGQPSPLQVRLLGEVALETARGGLNVDEVAAWLRRIFDDSLLAGTAISS